MPLPAPKAFPAPHNACRKSGLSRLPGSPVFCPAGGRIRPRRSSPHPSRPHQTMACSEWTFTGPHWRFWWCESLLSRMALAGGALKPRSAGMQVTLVNHARHCIIEALRSNVPIPDLLYDMFETDPSHGCGAACNMLAPAASRCAWVALPLIFLRAYTSSHWWGFFPVGSATTHMVLGVLVRGAA